MLKNLAKVLSVAVVIVAVISNVKFMVDTKKANEEQAYREQIESTVYTDGMNGIDILNTYFEYEGQNTELVSFYGIEVDDYGERVYSVKTRKGSSTYYSWYNAEYVTNYVNYKIQQEKLAEAGF